MLDTWWVWLIQDSCRVVLVSIFSYFSIDTWRWYNVYVLCTVQIYRISKLHCTISKLHNTFQSIVLCNFKILVRTEERPHAAGTSIAYQWHHFEMFYNECYPNWNQQMDLENKGENFVWPRKMQDRHCSWRFKFWVKIRVFQLNIKTCWWHIPAPFQKFAKVAGQFLIFCSTFSKLRKFAKCMKHIHVHVFSTGASSDVCEGIFISAFDMVVHPAIFFPQLSVRTCRLILKNTTSSGDQKLSFTVCDVHT